MEQTMRLGGKRVAAALIAVAALTALTSAATRGPDPAGYTGTDAVVYSFIDLAGGGAAAMLDDTDDATVALTLPFAFQFYGQPRTLLCVSANGAAYFVADLAACSGIVDFANTDLSVTSSPGDTPGLFPLWSDLTFDQPGAGSVLYQTLGSAGSRRFVVQWQNAYPSGGTSPVTFQMILSEGTNEVLFQYKTVDLGDENPASRGAGATIGIRNAEALVSGQQIQWSFGVPVIGNESALRFVGNTSWRFVGSGTTQPPRAANRPRFRVDIRTSPLGGSLQYADAAIRMAFASTSITSAVVNGNTMNVEGVGTVNGVAGFTFTATLVDNPDQIGITIRQSANQTVTYSAPLQPVTSGSFTLQ
jgi:hypothetical protein